MQKTALVNRIINGKFSNVQYIDYDPNQTVELNITEHIIDGQKTTLNIIEQPGIFTFLTSLEFVRSDVFSLCLNHNKAMKCIN